MVTGKQRRLGRLLAPDSKTLLVAVDHSLTTGPARSLSDMPAIVQAIVSGGADAVIAHRGTATHALPVQRQTGLVIHLSGNSRLTTDSDIKARVCDPQTAAMLGADAVSVHVTLGCDHSDDRRALADLGRIAGACDRLGLPLVVMSYARSAPEDRGRATLHAARIVAELGADIVKTSHPGDEYLAELALMLDVPVVIAGGEVAGDWRQFTLGVRTIMASGIAGLCVGRRIFTDADPARATAALQSLVHGGPHGGKRPAA